MGMLKNNGGEIKNDKWVGLIYTQLLNKLSWKVPVAQDLKIFKFPSKPEQPGLSSLICLEVVCIRTQDSCVIF